MVWISGVSIVIHFAAQAIDVDIDYVRCGINPHAPNVIQNHRASNYTPGIPAEIFQEGKLLWGQLEQLIAASSLMTHKVKLQVRSLQAYRVILRRRRSAQKISQPRKQFRKGEWLRQIVISALLQSLDSLVHGTARRQDQHRSGNTLGAASPNQIQTIHVGKTEVNDECIVDAFQGLKFPRLSIAGCIHLVSRFHQCLLRNPWMAMSSSTTSNRIGASAREDCTPEDMMFGTPQALERSLQNMRQGCHRESTSLSW